MSEDQHTEKGDRSTALAEVKPKLKKPSLFKVLMMNDDFTPMDFVVEVLRGYFSMSMEKATEVMLHVHTRGVGVCGVFPLDIAETKVRIVNDYAKENQHPLKCIIEKA